MPSDPIGAPVVESPERRAFYERISRQNLTPLWLSLANLVTPEPVSGCPPAAWTFTEIRAAMLEAGSLFTAKEAERRVLSWRTPASAGNRRSRPTSTRACSWCSPAKSPPPIAMPRARSDSCWKEAAHTRP